MPISAQQVIDAIQRNLGVPWKSSTSDIFHTGTPETAVTGIVTTFAPTVEVLRRTVAAKKNMIICREAPFWERALPSPARLAELAKDATYRFKRNYIEKNGLVIWRFVDNWAARPQDGQLVGLAKALGWEKYYKPSAGQPWARGNGFFALPPATLQETAKNIKARLKMRGMRIIGDPRAKVSRAALSHGYFLVPELRSLLKEPGVDLVVIGEPVEWEASPYFSDLVASGEKKGMIVLGNAVSEEPGSGEVASWLKIFLKEVSIEWIPAGEPVWMPS